MFLVFMCIVGATCASCITASATAARLFFDFFVSADRALFFPASATSCSFLHMFFSANCAVIFCTSTAAAHCNSAAERQTRKQTGYSHTGQQFLQFFCIHCHLHCSSRSLSTGTPILIELEHTACTEFSTKKTIPGSHFFLLKTFNENYYRKYR